MTQLIFVAASLNAVFASTPKPTLSELFIQGQSVPEHKVLAKMLGKWTVDVTYNMEDLPPQKSKADCEAKWAFDGLILFKEYKSQMMGKPFVVQQYLGYDTTSRFAWEFQIETNNSSALYHKGTIDKSGKSLEFQGRHPNPMKGNKESLFRYETQFKSENEYVTKWFETVDHGQEIMTVQLIHTRVPQ